MVPVFTAISCCDFVSECFLKRPATETTRRSGIPPAAGQKSPPSADFLPLALGPGLCLLALFERMPDHRLDGLRAFGGAPLFFRLLHFLLLRLLSDGAEALGWAGVSGRIEAASPARLWLVAAIVCGPLWLACRGVVALKRRVRPPVLSYL